VAARPCTRVWDARGCSHYKSINMFTVCTGFCPLLPCTDGTEWPPFVIFRAMSLDEMTMNSRIRVDICPATDFAAGVRSAACSFYVTFDAGYGVRASLVAEPELSDAVEDPEGFTEALRGAVERYVEDSARFSYLGKAGYLLPRGRKYVLGTSYSVVLWVGRGDDGMIFHFMPARNVGTGSRVAGSVPKDAAVVPWNSRKTM